MSVIGALVLLGGMAYSTAAPAAEAPLLTPATEAPLSPADQLGKLDFPTSGSPEAQASFLLGLKLLHNFEYAEALEAFRQARTIQPDFAMAYWGEAMCHNHALWGEQDLEPARKVLKELEGLPSPNVTPRERGFLDAVNVLYQEGGKADRDVRYAEAMRQLYVQYPDDDESASFYALALLGTRAGDRDIPVFMKAASVLEDIFLRNPNHPGVLHYLIHAYDDPVHAPLGLRAAARYGKVAASSAHARHMTSHIHLPLGMWGEYIQANEESWAASLERIKHQNLQPGDHDIHALHTLQWLQYGYLQQGRTDKAWESLRGMEAIHAENPSPMTQWYLGVMHASYVVEAPNWQDVDLDLDLNGVELSAPASSLFAKGLIAIRRNTTGAERVRKQMEELRADAEHKVNAGGDHHASFFTGVNASSISASRIMETQLESLQLLADGRTAEALDRLQDAIAGEEKMSIGYGPPIPVKPSLELLGEVLLNVGRPGEAVKSFQKSLERNPGRSASLVGLLEAARQTGDEGTVKQMQQEITLIQGDGASPYRAWQELPFAATPK